MRRRIAAKLRGRAGESIVETLVALLISSLALLMLAGAFSASTHVIERTQELMMEYYAMDARFVARVTNETDAEKKVFQGDDLKVTLTQIMPEGGTGINQSYGSMSWFLNGKLTDIPVIQYVPIKEEILNDGL